MNVIRGGLHTETRDGPATAYDAGHRAHPDGDVTGDRGLRRAGVSGQVAVEWLMVAGILTAVAIVLTGLLQPVLVSAVRMIARSVRTVGL
jgi:hypothetical protein